MTRRCRIGCNNLRGDTDVVCRACWACLPFAMRQEVADARIGTLAARVAARRVYEWLAAQQTAPVVVMGVELPDAGHDWPTAAAIGDPNAVPMPGEGP